MSHQRNVGLLVLVLVALFATAVPAQPAGGLPENISMDDLMKLANRGKRDQCPPPKICPKGQRPAVNNLFIPQTTGCAKYDMPVSTDVDFSKCCNKHNICYSTCNKSRQTCDSELNLCMKQKCATEDSSSEGECESAAEVYSMALQMMGCQQYQKAQKEGCSCVPIGKTPSKSKKVAAEEKDEL